MQVNADRSAAVVVPGGTGRWIPSPEPGVERLMLERDGGEVARATSIVRYAPGSRFNAHVHGGGEEFLVLEGVFCDEWGEYPAGTYVRNPPGSSHAPFSPGGCTIFVKLRQMSPADVQHVVARPAAQSRSTSNGAERWTRELYHHGREQVSLRWYPAGSPCGPHSADGGVELLVVEGTLQSMRNDSERLTQWSWVRRAEDSVPVLECLTDVLLWVKCGHLP